MKLISEETPKAIADADIQLTLIFVVNFTVLTMDKFTYIMFHYYFVKVKFLCTVVERLNILKSHLFVSQILTDFGVCFISCMPLKLQYP